MIVRVRSSISGTINEMDLNITERQFERLRDRVTTNEHVQDIVPELSKIEREFLISGMTKDEQIMIFGLCSTCLEHEGWCKCDDVRDMMDEMKGAEDE